MSGTLVWGIPQSWWLILAIVGLAVGLLLWGYRGVPGHRFSRWWLAFTKALALALLALLLAEPLWHGVRPRPGANLLLILADNSVSLRVADAPGGSSRGEQLRQWLDDDAPWLVRLGQDFSLRRYIFDSRVTAVHTFKSLDFAGTESAAGRAVEQLARQYAGRPVAGIVVLTDGISTDVLPRNTENLPPIYPVLVGETRQVRDLQVRDITSSYSNFEAAPITITATIAAEGLTGKDVVVQVVDESGKVQQEQTWKVGRDATRQFTFRFRPTDTAAETFQVRAFLAHEAGLWGQATHASQTEEITLDNNARTVRPQIDRGPYRVLYVAGRPNWDFKYLRRALDRDQQVKLIAVIRIAKREAKFDFRGRMDDANPLFRGFAPADAEQVERYDEPVLLRLAVESADQLREGFPSRAEDLFAFDAVILDDIEAAFFTGDQLSLLHRFVSQRGGGLLLMAGSDTFIEGGYSRTLLEDLAPVYIPTSVPPDAYPDGSSAYRLQITREGQLQPWVRLRPTLEEEQRRLAELPDFRVRNAVSHPKPGAATLLTVTDPEGKVYPALVVQRFGRGRTGALLIGDLWRWKLRQADSQHAEDFDYQWMQIVRWLVTGGLRRVEVEIEKSPADRLAHILVRVHDRQYQPLDNATVKAVVTAPDGTKTELTIGPHEEKPGVYHEDFVCHQTGVYRMDVSTQTPDGESCEPVKTGWVHEPLVEELRTVTPLREPWEQLARSTAGQVIRLEQLESFARRLPSHRVPITEPWVYPVWHRWTVLGLIVAGLLFEWAWRRLRGLP